MDQMCPNWPKNGVFVRFLQFKPSDFSLNLVVFYADIIPSKIYGFLQGGGGYETS